MHVCLCVCVWSLQGSAVQAAVWSILMFIDRKINGALIQTLALTEEREEVKVWWLAEEQEKEEDVKNERAAQMKVNGKAPQGCVYLQMTEMGLKPWWMLSGMSNYMCEQPVVAYYSLFSLCFTELLSRVDEQASNGTWEAKKKKKGKKEEKQERRVGGEGENQFSQTEAGWSNGGLKEEEEERTYFPLITSCSLPGKPSKL